MAQLLDDIVLDASAGVHRPRNLDWKRAAALLYGDWGTSKAYVIGLAFVAAGFSSLPIILAVCALTGLVGINYAVICRHFPDGGGVYSAARSQGRLLAVVGALLLLADLTVTGVPNPMPVVVKPVLRKRLHRSRTCPQIIIHAGWNRFLGSVPN